METIEQSPNVYQEACPPREVFNLISGRWTALVIGLLEEPQRFSQLQRGIGGISQKMLTQTLRQLEANGLVKRTVYAQVPPRVEYALTSLGQTLRVPLAAIRDWAQINIDEIMTARAAYEAER